MNWIRAISIFVLLTMNGADAASSKIAPSIQPLADCRLPGVDETVRCGQLNVPEDPNRPQGRSISLFVVVLPVIGAGPGLEPWVELVGGPGNAATDSANSYATDYRSIRQHRDVLLVDQRGTGRSNGLYCEELALHRVSSFFPRWPPAAVRACRARLSAKADLSQYSSRNAAHDLEAVRRWLGYSGLNIFSSSYGTRAALEYMRIYPRSVRSAILWSVVPPDFRRPLYYARDGQIALDRLIADCRNDPKCRLAYPDVGEELGKVMTDLGREPRPITIEHPVTTSKLDAVITPAGLAQAIWVALTYPDKARQLPTAIHAAVSGDFGPFLALDVATEPPRRTYYNAMHLSVVCPEETSHIKPGDLSKPQKKTFMPSDRTLEYVEACRSWGLRPVRRAELHDVRVNIPTLILSGYMDPVTPPSWGTQVHAALTNGRHIIVRDLSHETNGLSGAECLDKIFMQFVSNPTAKSFDTACLASISPPAFAIGDAKGN